MNISRRTMLLFLAPMLAGLLFLQLGPMLLVIAQSFLPTESRPLRLSELTTEQYRACMSIDQNAKPSPSDPRYWTWLGGQPRDPRLFAAFANSLVYSCMAVPTGLLAALAMAGLLNRNFFAAPIVRTIFYLPNLLGGLAAIMIWSWLLNPRFGPINEAIRLLYGLLDTLVRIFDAEGTSQWSTPDWLYSPTSCKSALVLMHLWSVGGSMLVFLAALRKVPTELNDAAAIDGAGWWAKARHVTLPQLAPALVFNGITSWTFAMQCFAEPFVLQNRRQEDSLLFVGLYLYQTAFDPPYRMTYASAIACLLFVLLAITTVPFYWFARKWWLAPIEQS